MFSYYKDKNRTVIKYNNEIYYLERIENPDEVIEQYNISKDYDIFYSFVINMNDSIVSQWNNGFYVLLKDNLKSFEDFNLDMNSLSVNSLISLNWRELWMRKSDYIEYYYANIVGKYKLVDESVNYYLGMLEMAIYYLYDYKDYNDAGFIVHKEFNKNSLFNPLNLKIDVKERDFAEYLKFIFYNNEYKNIDVEKLINKYKDYYNFELVIARLLYPNYYFDLFEKIILLEESENALLNIISRNQEYEVYLKKIITFIGTFFKVKKIDWL